MAISNIRTLEKELQDELLGEIKEAVSNTVQNATYQIWAALSNATPRRTGRARSSWIITTNTPSTRSLPPVDENKLDHYQPDFAEAEVKSRVNPKRPFSIKWIANNVDYIEELNAGVSPQALADFVDTEITKVWSKIGV